MQFAQEHPYLTVVAGAVAVIVAATLVAIIGAIVCDIFRAWWANRCDPYNTKKEPPIGI